MGSVACVNRMDCAKKLYSDNEKNDISIMGNMADCDIKDMDWRRYLEHFAYIASNISDYRKKLNRELSDIDIQICDIMHYIELYNVSEEESLNMIKLLKEYRTQRRDVKDEMLRVEYFQKAIGNSSNITKAKEGIKLIDRLSNRTYRPRKLNSLFENCPKKTIREKNVCTKGDEMMKYSRQETVFDNKENDWLQFAKQQAEFYDNAQQYIYNLQSDIHEIDDEIEKQLCEIEGADCSIIQGYKIVKRLKELRNIKNTKQKELDCLCILTKGLNCGSMGERIHSCIDEMGGSVMENRKESSPDSM